MSIYKEDQISWSIWLYKDIGFQGEKEKRHQLLQFFDAIRC